MKKMCHFFVTFFLIIAICSAAFIAEQWRAGKLSQKKYQMLEEVSAMEEGESPSIVVERNVPTVADTEESDAKIEDRTTSIDFSKLPQECIAWLRINSAELSFPVMQCGDNSFYLNHDYTGAPDKNGSVFMDHNTSIEDVYSIVYGHNMTNTGAMFNSLFDVEVGDEMILSTPDNGDEVWTCFAKYETTKKDSAFKVGWSEQNINALVSAACEAAGSPEVKITEGQQVMSLVTCDRAYAEADGRLVVMFVK